MEEEGGTQQKIASHKDILSKLHILQVTGFVDFIPTLLEYLVSQASCFKNGRLTSFIDNWRRITSDKEILQMVSGLFRKRGSGCGVRGQQKPNKPSIKDYLLTLIK